METLAPAAVRAEAPMGEVLGDAQVSEVFFAALEEAVAGQRTLVLVPDRTRNLPLSRLFPLLSEALHRARSVEVMVALGTHPPLPEAEIYDLLGVSGQPAGGLPGVANHAWADSNALASLGSVPEERLRQIAGPVWHDSLGGDLLVRINKRALEVDRVVIVGPTLPHEVAGFSGGAKYLFPGISGPEMIDKMHWLGALSGVLATIGYKETPVRALIDEAALLLPTPVSLVALVTDSSGDGDQVAGVYAGDPSQVWEASVARAGILHVSWLDHPYKRVVSCPMPIYDELWTAGKAMYKLEAAVADGGELVIYAPQLSRVSITHGEAIYKVGYHPLAYFLGQWQRFEREPLAVLAHSSHVRGAGTYDAGGGEHPRIDVQLATAIPPEDCRQLNLGYVDPASLDLAALAAEEGTLVVPRSGEVLFRVKS
ncbi:MAG: lactate racemase domain-containing protein [Acidimicrobiales bacterium]